MVPRNLVNPEVAESVCKALSSKVENEHVVKWIHSTFRKWYLEHGPTREVITTARYADLKIHAYMVSQTDPDYALALQRMGKMIRLVTPEHPDWVTKALHSHSAVQELQPPDPDASHVRIDPTTEALIPYTIDSETGAVPASHHNLNDYAHWIDYLTHEVIPKVQVRNTIPHLIVQVNAWDKQLHNQKLVAELAGDCTPIQCSTLEGTDMFLVRLDSENAYKRESKLMKNCVKSYFKDNQRGKVEIWSLRSFNNSRPVATIEIRLTPNPAVLAKQRTYKSITGKSKVAALPSLTTDIVDRDEAGVPTLLTLGNTLVRKCVQIKAFANKQLDEVNLAMLLRILGEFRIANSQPRYNDEDEEGDDGFDDDEEDEGDDEEDEDDDDGEDDHPEDDDDDVVDEFENF